MKTIRCIHNAESHEPDLAVQTVPLASIKSVEREKLF